MGRITLLGVLLIGFGQLLANFGHGTGWMGVNAMEGW